MSGFVDYLLRPEHLLTMSAVWAILVAVQRLFPALTESAIWARMLPLMPIVLCSAAVWLPGLVDDGPSEKVLLGIALGSFCGQFHKTLAQTVFGNDARITGG